jgi:hypothetical protein
MHAAAVAATQELHLRMRPSSDERTQSVMEWIFKYSQQLTKLSLDTRPHVQLLDSLPCPNLLELELSNCDVQLGEAATRQSGFFEVCTKLTRLDLRCSIIDAPAGAVLDSLSSLVHLQHLDVAPMQERTQYMLGGFVWCHTAALAAPDIP